MADHNAFVFGYHLDEAALASARGAHDGDDFFDHGDMAIAQTFRSQWAHM